MEEPQRKRRKVSVACLYCRERKTRCDGSKPVCGPCQRRTSDQPVSCIYKLDVTSLSAAEDQIRELLARVHQLESNRGRTSVTVADGTSASTSALSTDPTRTQACDHNAPPESVLNSVTGTREMSSSHVNQPFDRNTGAQNWPVQVVPVVRSAMNPNPETDHPESMDCSRIFESNIGGSHPGDCATVSTEAFGITNKESSHDSASRSNGVPVDDTVSPSLSQSNSTDAMGAVPTYDEHLPEMKAQYYGKSSATSFLQSICKTMNLDHCSPTNHISCVAGLDTLSSCAVVSEKRITGQPNLFLQAIGPRSHLEDFVLPPRSLADHFLDRYWTRVHPLYPFLHKPTFEKAYRLLWTGSPDVSHLVATPGAGLGNSVNGSPKSQIFYCALNAMFALGCVFSDIPAASRKRTSNAFFDRAMSLLQVEIMDEGSMSVVQTLLLIGQYLQSTSFPNRCWNVIGVACRIGQGLGLHIEQGQNSHQGLEIETRRRVWYGCLIFDLVVSMTLGRPTMASYDCSVPLPSMPDSEYARHSYYFTPPDELVPRTSFYPESIKLYKILGSILSTVYESKSLRISGDHGTLQPESSFDAILGLHNSLTRFHADLPPELRWNISDGDFDTTNIPKQRSHGMEMNVLHARFLHLLILLYRPIFTQLCQSFAADNHPARRAEGLVGLDSEDSKMRSYFAMRCSASCVRASIELIGLVHHTFLTEATGAWWYNVFYVYSAGMVVVLAKLCSSLEGLINKASLEKAWEICQENLQDTTSYGPRAQQCLQSLRTLDAQVTSCAQGGMHVLGPSTATHMAVMRSSLGRKYAAGIGPSDNQQPPAEDMTAASIIAGLSNTTPQSSNQRSTATYDMRELGQDNSNSSNALDSYGDQTAARGMDFEDWWSGATFDLFLADTSSVHTAFG